MAPPKLSPAWVQLTPNARLRTVQFGNITMALLFFHGRERIASYISATLSADFIQTTNAGDGVVDIKVHFGNRDDLWGQVIARRLIEILHNDVLLVLSAQSPSSEEETREVLDALKCME